MRYLTLPAVLLLLLLPLLGPCTAVGEERDADVLVTRLFDVGALTRGRQGFLCEQAPSVDGLAERDGGLFGSEWEELIYPLGQVDELIELLKVHVQPRMWESTEGAFVRSMGEQTLVVHCPPAVADDVAAYLAKLQQRISRRAVMELETFRLTTTQVAALFPAGRSDLMDQDGLEALRGGETAGPAAALMAYERHWAATFLGRQRAHVSGYRPDLAKGAQAFDPMVSVANLGLAAQLRTTLGPQGRSASVEIGATLTRLLASRAVESGAGALELPEYAVASIRSTVFVPVGAWTLVDGQSSDDGAMRWMFAVRVRTLGDEGLAERARGVELLSPPHPPALGGVHELERHTFDVGLLGERTGSRSSESVHLMPFGYVPPEPPELPEPAPIYPADSLVELLRECVVPRSWESDSASIEARNGHLYVCNTRSVLDAIWSNLETLRREALWTLVTTSEVLELESALARRPALSVGSVLDDAGQAELKAALAGGQAKRLGTARVITTPGGRNHTTQGSLISYLADYDVRVAEAAFLAGPVIERCLSGSILDVESQPTVGAQSIETTIRFTRSNMHTPLRRVATPHGEIDVPELDVFRVRAALRVPLGQTVVVASAGEGGRHRLLLLTCRRQPAGLR